MFLLQTPTLSSTSHTIVREERPKTAFSTTKGKDIGRISEEVDSVLDALKDNRIGPQGKHPLYSTLQSLEALYDLGENWNGYEVSAPNPDSIEKAKQWLHEIHNDAKCNNHRWFSPHVTANEEGDIVLEWVRGRKRLSVYISSSEAWYIKAWGPSIQYEMSDGTVTTASDRIALWTWILE